MQTKQRNVPFKISSAKADGTIEGYGSVFDVIDSYDEVVLPGAFTATLEAHKAKGSMPKMLWQHDSRQVPGKWDRMAEDKHGLFVQGHLILGTQLGKEAYILLKEQALDGLSIGFSVPKGGYFWNEGEKIGELRQINLWEVSPVTFPANPDATITAVRSVKTIREFEDFLRDVGGYSANQAKRIAAHGFKAVSETRDEGEALAAIAAAVQRNIMSITPS